ncbi:ATP-binding protein [Haliovirga abyssi]|uniref:Chemotaxis protein CheA n=1 Tax=Haliovirga abyssi TaxID=2996794 RepID=A0AAU9DUI3_9FUSO|nr:ATP-binding protein [Haliovirga abyssi]BDU49636.1 chemotaxis protein CheA [Haliovirga abyssi]
MMKKFDEENIEILVDVLEEIDIYKETIERSILKFEKESNNEIVDELFRAYHSIKGIVGFANLDSIATIASFTEKILKTLKDKNENIENKDEIVSLLLDSIDLLKEIEMKINEALSSKGDKKEISIDIVDIGEEEFKKRVLDIIGEKEEKSELVFDNLNYEYEDKIISQSFEKYTYEFGDNLKIAEESLLNLENKFSEEEINVLMRAFHSIKGGAGLLLILQTNENTKKIFKLIEKVAHSLEDLVQVAEYENDSKDFDSFYKGIDILKGIYRSLSSKEKTIKINNDYLEKVNRVSKEENKKQNEDKQEEDKQEEKDKKKIAKIKTLKNFNNQFIEYLKKNVIEKEEYNVGKSKRISKGLRGSLKNLKFNEKLDFINDIINSIENEEMQEIKDKLEELKKWDFEVEKPLKNKSQNEEAEKKNINIKSNGKGDNETTLKKVATNRSIRLSKDKVDKMVNLVSELLTLKNQQANLTKDVSGYKEISGKMKKVYGNFERLTLEFQNIVMSMRMVGIENLFNRYRRTVRDSAKALGKEVELIIEGGETAIDEDIMELLSDPLTHMVRNSVDHGLGMPEEREENGKTRTGHVTLRAYNKGGFIFIEVEDDGRGLNHNKILQKAGEKELINDIDIEKLTPEDIYQFIFLPGFSTSEKVTNLSGRGVGMDVVKTNITSLGGRIIINSKEGEGTKFILKIPLSLSIIKGLMVKLDKGKYILPLENIRENIKLKKSNIRRYKNSYLAVIRDEPIPLIDIKFLTGKSLGEIINKEYFYDLIPIVVLDIDGENYGIVADGFIEENEYMVKPIPDFLKGNNLFSGTTILGDGSLVLILNPTTTVTLKE